jgi:four helix bundle protein
VAAPRLAATAISKVRLSNSLQFQLGVGHAGSRGMDRSSLKPFDINVRAFIFACDVIRAFPRDKLDTASMKVWSPLVASATSTGAHLEEASAGGSRAQFLALIRGAVREARESSYWLRVMTATQLAGHDRVAMLVEESRELVAILTTIARNTARNG